MDRFEVEARGRKYLAASLAALDERLGSQRDWVKIRRVIERMVPHFNYEWMWLGLLPYSEYLKTDHWSKQREMAITRAGGRCQVCNRDGELHTHHRTYANLGSERSEDLIVLCERCHSLFHEHCELSEKEDQPSIPGN